jgi:hypothetical protein
MRTETVPAAASPRPGSRAPRGLGALAGLLACGAALGVAELAAGVVGAQASPLVAVGGSAIDATPEWLRDFAIRTFGDRDKLVLLAGIAAVLAGFAVAVGLLATRRPRLGLAGVAVFGPVGAAAALSRPGAAPIDALPSTAGALAGAVALTALTRAVLTSTDGPEEDVGREHSGLSTTGVGVDRRRFLVTGVAAAGGAVVAGVGGRVLGGRSDVGASRAGVAIPRPAGAAGPLAEGAAIELPGLSSFFTPNRDFYRVDTALVVPRIAAEDWRLRSTVGSSGNWRSTSAGSWPGP